MDLRGTDLVETPSEVVNFDKATPTTVGVVFDPNTPATTDVLYVSSVDASTWIYNGTSYVTYSKEIPASTAFYLLGTTIDAGANKTAAIQHLGPLRATKFTGDGLNITGINASNLSTGTVATARLGSGTANSTTYLRGDQTWATISAGGLTYFTEAQNSSAPNATVYVDSLTAVSSTTDADISIVPKGTGAFQLAVPDNTTAGGNKRGLNSVDLQTASRSSANQVASGNYVSLLGGYRNRATGNYSVTAGNQNLTSGQSSVALGELLISSAVGSIALGTSCTSSGSYSFSSGLQSTATNSYAVAMGYLCTASGQSSVSLGASNNISGTSGFGAGGNNTNSGNYSAVFGFSNTISGEYTIRAGYGNTGNAAYSVTTGYNNAVSGSENGCFGSSSTVNANYAFSLGYRNTANALNSLALCKDANTFSIINKVSIGATQFTSNGDNQLGKLIVSASTTDTTVTTLTSDRAAASTTNQLILQNQQVISFEGIIQGKQATSTNIGVWKISGTIVRGANAASTTLVVSSVTLVTNASSWGTPTLAADTTNGGLRVQVSGLTATNIKWNCRIDTLELLNA